MSTCVSRHTFLFCVCLLYSGLFVILLTCLISKEREKKVWDWKGGDVGRIWEEVKEEKPRSEYTV